MSVLIELGLVTVVENMCSSFWVELLLGTPLTDHPFILSFIHSGYFYSASSSALLFRGAPDTAWTLLEFNAKVSQATASEQLTQGPYVAATVGFKPITLRTKGVEPTNEPPHPTWSRGWQVVILGLTDHDPGVDRCFSCSVTVAKGIQLTRLITLNYRFHNSITIVSFAWYCMEFVPCSWG